MSSSFTSLEAAVVILQFAHEDYLDRGNAREISLHWVTESTGVPLSSLRHGLAVLDEEELIHSIPSDQPDDQVWFRLNTGELPLIRAFIQCHER